MSKGPEVRTPGQSHLDPKFIIIEELFWAHKPATNLVQYDQRFGVREGALFKNPPSLDPELAIKIWSKEPQFRVKSAGHTAHLSVFAIPAFIDILDAKDIAQSTKLPRMRRYSESNFVNNSSTFWSSHLAAIQGEPGMLGANIEGFHPSSRAKRHYDPDAKLPFGEFIGIPQSALAFSSYEVVRIGEELTHNYFGTKLTDDEKTTHYKFFREILYDGGIWMPEKRDDMEEIATQLDSLSELNHATQELSERTIRKVLVPDGNLRYDIVRSVLRPGAKEIFTTICRQYDYFGQGPRS